MASLQMAGSIADTINGTITLAAIQIAQGRLREAIRTYERALRLATAPSEGILRGTADIYVGMSEVAYEQNNLPAATQHLLEKQGAGRAHRVPTKSLSLAYRDGPHPRGRGRF